MPTKRERVSFQQLYRQLPVVTKLGMHASILALLVAISVSTATADLLPSILTSAAALFVLHLLLSNPSPVKVGGALVGSTVLIVAAAAIAAEITFPEDAAWVFLMWSTGLVIATLIYTTLAYRYSKGRVWLTVLLSVLTATFAGMILVITLAPVTQGDTTLALLLSVILGGGAVILRSASRTKKAILPEDDAPRLAGLKPPAGIVIKRRDAATVVGSDSKGRLFILTAHKVDEELSDHQRKGLTYSGFPLGGWLAEAFFSAQKDVPNKTPFTRVVSISGDPSLDRQYRVINLVAKDRGASNVHVYLVGAKDPLKQIADLLVTEKREPATPEAIKKSGTLPVSKRTKRRR